MIHELTQTLYLDTPKGQGRAKFLIYNGDDADIEWVCVFDNGEIWSFRNYDVKVAKNITMGVRTDD